MDRRTERLGLAYAGACVLNGAFVPGVARLTTEGADAVFVATVTALFAAGTAALVLTLGGRLRPLVARRTAPGLAAIGVLGTGLSSILFFEGARRTSAVETVLCLQVEPVYALLVAWLFLGHRLTVRRLAALGVLLLGIALALGGGQLSDATGVALLLATPVCWQASHLIALRGLIGVAPPVLTGARYVYGGVALSAWWALSGAQTGLAADDALSGRLPLLALQGVGLSYVGTLAWYQAIARLDLSRATAIVVPSIPLVSVAASFALVGELPTSRQWWGLVLTALGVLAFVTAPHAVERRERIPAATAPIAAPADPESGSDAA